jgi:uncharacterized protein involved in response to NO
MSIGMIRSTRPEPQVPQARAEGAALWRLGFRPFYLLASIFAALSVPLWALQYAGWLPRAYLAGPLWHAHEMLFGFTSAVVAGFLLTAVRNWTGRATPAGAWLMAIAAQWVAGRVLVLTPFGALAAAVNAAFPVAVAIGIGIPLVRSGNRRNYFFIALLLVLALAILATHLAQLGLIALPARLGIGVALDVVVFIMAVMAGRVVPMFTNNGVPGARARRLPLLEKLALGGIGALLVADLLQATGAAVAGLLAFLAVVHAARLALWQPWKTLRTPLVWVLHGAYLWIPVHLALRALVETGFVAEPLATHALTIGAIGGLTLGMMTRTARGHTGRILAADRFDVTCYLLVLAAALVRLGGPLVAPGAYVESVVCSSLLWSAAFAIYAVRYWPSLTRPRVDGGRG